MGNSKYANAATKYFVVQKTGTGNDTVYTGVTTYTGYTNVPTLDVDNNDKKAMTLDADKNGIAEVVFVMPTTESASDTLVYVTGSYSSDGTKTTYDVIVKGEATKMVLNDVNNAKVAAGLYNVNNGNVTAAVMTSNLYLSYNGGILMSSSTANGTYAVGATIKIVDSNGQQADKVFNTVGAEVPVYTFESGACTASTAADLAGVGGTVTFAYTTSGNVSTITAIYIVK